MTAALGDDMGRSRSTTRLMHGIAGAASGTVPIVRVPVFQRQIVSGMTAGAVE